MELSQKILLLFSSNNECSIKDIPNNTLYSTSIQTFSYSTEFTLKQTSPQRQNFYRNGEELRISFLQKLVSKGILLQTPKRKYNSIIIFDWDDTFLCSSYLINNCILNGGVLKQIEKHKEKIKKLEEKVFSVLSLSIKIGDTFIITNATIRWVEYSVINFFPSIIPLLKRTTIISAREKYESLYPNGFEKWKKNAFFDVAKKYNKLLVTNILCFGDSDEEMEAVKQIGEIFPEVYIKLVKFKEKPKPYQLIKQLDLIEKEINNLHSMTRNVEYKFEKKQKIKI